MDRNICRKYNLFYFKIKLTVNYEIKAYYK